MLIAFILLLIGFLLVFIEFFIPGIVIGVMGGILIISSIVLFAIESNSIIATFAFIVSSVVGFVLVIKFALWKMQNSSPDYSVYSDDNQQGYYAANKLPDAVGKTAVAMTDLRPGGYVNIDGHRVQALSRSGYITKGSEVEIIANEEENLIVKIKR